MSDKDPRLKLSHEFRDGHFRPPKLQFKPQLARAVWAFTCLYALRPFLPSFIIPTILISGFVWFLVQIPAFPRWSDELKYVKMFSICFLIMAVELGIENFLVWAVSATDQHKYEYRPLQDNIRLITQWLMDKNTFIGMFVRYQTFDTLIFLLVALMLALSAPWDQAPYSGFGMMSRFCLTIAASRSIRVVSFFSTVLPSPRLHCYANRFPPPPDNWYDWIKVGVSQMRGFGGCNDLIFSGHAALWVLTPLLYRSFYQPQTSLGQSIVPLFWSILVIVSIQDVVTLQHYSVDMFLAVVVTWFVWNKLEFIYSPSDTVSMIKNPNTKLPKFVIGLILVGVSFAAILVFVGRA